MKATIYKAGYLICVRGTDGVTKGTNKVFNNLRRAKEYINKLNKLHPNIELSIRLQ